MFFYVESQSIFLITPFLSIIIADAIFERRMGGFRIKAEDMILGTPTNWLLYSHHIESTQKLAVISHTQY